MLAVLLARGTSCAPHVLARVARELGGHAAAIRETVEILEPAVRRGLRQLPSPLPVTPTITERYSTLVLDDRDHELLLATVLCAEARLEPLLAFDGRSAEEIAASSVGSHLRVHAGRVSLLDPLMAVWIRGTASSAEESAVHERLAAEFRTAGDRANEDWHRAKASFRQDPAAAPELIRIARALSEVGHTERALRTAGEAAAHAMGEERDEARLVAGASAIAAGYAVEAAAYLGGLFPDGVERYRMQGLSGLLIAEAHLLGSVPEVEPMTLRPGGDDPADVYSWARAAAFAAVMCAERGEIAAMRAWLSALRDASARVGADRDLRDPVVALAGLLVGDPDAADSGAHLQGELLQALHAAWRGDIDLGLRVLATAASGVGTPADAFVAGFEHSPLMHAYRAVLEAFLLTWRGDIATARDRLHRASLEAPVAMPFGGLGVMLARRLDLLVTGGLGPFSRSLTAALPPAARIDALMDRAVGEYLAGSFDEAATAVHLWGDRRRRRLALSVPMLDEVAAEAESPGAGPAVEPPDIARARRLRARIRTTPDGRWNIESVIVADEARTVASPFERARVEGMLGIRFAIRDDVVAARRHLTTALRLFEESGARAWAAAIASRLARLGGRADVGDAEVDPLEACRRVWQPILTARELEVAMRVARGASNRDIGAELRVSVRTVEVHLGRVFAKLDVRSRVELTVLAHRTGQRR